MSSARVDYDQRWQAEWKELQRLGPLTRSLHRLIGRMLKPYLAEGTRVLDVGCGSGRLLTLLVGLAPDLVLIGIEGSWAAVAQAPKLLRGRIVQEDVVSGFFFKGPPFDVVICSEVLEHLEDYRPALESIAAHTRPGGHAFITVPHSMRQWSRSDEFAGHIRRFEYDEFYEELRSVALQPLQYFTWGFPVGFLYNRFVTRIDPSNLMRPSKSFGAAKAIVTEVLYQAMKVDDFCTGRRWHQLVALTRRTDKGPRELRGGRSGPPSRDASG